MSTLQGSRSEDDASLTLEAMRLGVVPATDSSAYTVGREREIEAVRAELARVEEKGGAVRAFLGDYGTGKTHLLEMAWAEALSRNFLVARATLDQFECAPSHPKRVYRALASSLTYPDLFPESVTRDTDARLGVAPLLRMGAASDEALERFRADGRYENPREHLDQGAHLYLTPALRYLREVAEADRGRGKGRRKKGDPESAAARTGALERETDLAMLFDWIEGHPTLSNQEIDREMSQAFGHRGRLYSLKDYRPWARIYGYLLSGVAALARAVGYAGLLVLIDEAEFYSLLSSENRAFAEGVFRALSWASLGEGTALPFAEDALAFGGAGILKELPASYAPDAGLATIFAMTPNADGMAILQACVPQGHISEISPLTAADYAELARRVCDYYVSARPEVDVPAAVIAPLGQVISGLVGHGLIENPRQAMKFTIDFLDVVRFDRSNVPKVLRGLRDRYLF